MAQIYRVFPDNFQKMALRLYEKKTLEIFKQISLKFIKYLHHYPSNPLPNSPSHPFKYTSRKSSMFFDEVEYFYCIQNSYVSGIKYHFVIQAKAIRDNFMYAN